MERTGPFLAIAAGGTGGHILPGIETGRALLASVPGSRAEWICGGRAIEQRIYTSHGIEPVRLRVGTHRGRGRTLVSKAEMVADTGAMLRRLRRKRPDAVLAFGGAACAPVIAAAKLLRIPIFLHESNAVPGCTTRLFARHARRVFLGMGGFEAPNAVLTGTPAAPPAEETVPIASRDTLLCAGGSQGASSLNELFLAALADPRIAELPLRFHLVAGPGKGEPPVPPGVPREKLTIVEYETNMGSVLARTRLAVSRAGAGTLADLAAHSVPALLVPYPHAADDHQAANAAHYAGRGGAETVREENLNTEELTDQLSRLLASEDRLNTMSETMGALAHRGAALRVVETILSELGVSGATAGARIPAGTGGTA